MSKTQSITLATETYELLQEVKKVFASYTGEDIEEFSDDKVIEILASGFFDTTEDDEEGWCCGGHGGCACHGEDKEWKEGCGCGHHH